MLDLREYILEVTQHAKKRNVKIAQNLFLKNKKYGGVKSFAVFTSQNPMSQEVDKKDNSKLIKDLKKTIKNYKYVYVSVDGFFDGNKEDSILVFNIKQEVVSNLCGKYNQTSFIYAEPDEDRVKFEYWEVEDTDTPYNKSSNNYIKKDEETKSIDGTNELGFTVIGKGKHEVKVTIPFSVFGYVNEKLLENAKNYAKERNCSVDTVFEWAINRIGDAAIPYRTNLNKNIITD
jgi:predicted RNA-binding protein with EMAP domain